MKYIGAHVSAAGGVFNAPLNAHAINANSYALFTKSQRQWNAPPLKRVDIDLFSANHATTKLNKEKVLAHNSYLINLASSDPELREKSLNAFVEEMRRCRELGITLLNFHPGAHLNAQPINNAIKQVADLINIALTKCKRVTPVVETTAGQGSQLGSKFEEIALLLSYIEKPERVKVCIDTCHSFNAGYDFRTEESYHQTMDEFGKIIGFHNLAGMHLNDSKTPFASNKDRHASLGEGEIGLDAFKFMMQDPRLDEIPLILETPNPEIWIKEISMLRGFEKNESSK